MRRLAGRQVGHPLGCPLACIVLTILIAGTPACKRKKSEAPVQPAAAQGGALSSMVHVADPSATLQLTRGFHQVEHDSWRWTEGSFAATLGAPPGSSQQGALLVLKFSIPDVVIQTLKTIRLSASVNGLALPPEEYSKSGQYTYVRDVPSSALAAQAVSVEFTLDKFLPPSVSDERALGVIVSAIGFEAK